MPALGNDRDWWLSDKINQEKRINNIRNRKVDITTDASGLRNKLMPMCLKIEAKWSHSMKNINNLNDLIKMLASQKKLNK